MFPPYDAPVIPPPRHRCQVDLVNNLLIFRFTISCSDGDNQSAQIQTLVITPIAKWKTGRRTYPATPASRSSAISACE